MIVIVLAVHGVDTMFTVAIDFIFFAFVNRRQLLRPRRRNWAENYGKWYSRRTPLLSRGQIYPRCPSRNSEASWRVTMIPVPGVYGLDVSLCVLSICAVRVVFDVFLCATWVLLCVLLLCVVWLSDSVVLLCVSC